MQLSSFSTFSSFSSLIASAGLLALAACGDSSAPSAPVEVRHAVVLPATVDGLKRLTPLAHDISVSGEFGRKGGWLSIPEAGIYVRVPNGVLDTPTKITMTALAGDMVAYEFEPHGIQFLVPLQASQNLKLTELAEHGDVGLGRLKQLRAAYFPTTDRLDAAAGTALVDELLPTSVDRTGNWITWSIWHFSGYMVSSGRVTPKNDDTPLGSVDAGAQ